MKLSKRFSLAAAFEELAEQEAVDTKPKAVEETSEELDIPVAEDTVETSVGEMDMAEGELDQADETVDTAETDLGTLNDVADKMEATEETGGLDAGSAEIVQVAVEALYMRLGGVRGKAMPSMEAFGGDSSRKKATRIAVENIREQAKKIGEAILAMIQKAWEFITGMFDKIFTASGRTRERALKLKAVLDKIEGTSSAAEVNGSAFGKSLVLAGNDTITVDSIVKGLGKTNSKGIQLIVERSMINAGSLQDFKQMIAGKPKDFAKKLAPQFKFDQFSTIKSDADYGKTDEGMAYFAVTDDEGLLGGTTIAILAPKEVSETFESVEKAVNSTSVVTQNNLTEKQLEAETFAKLPTLAVEDCKKLVEAVLVSLDRVDKMKASAEAVKKAGASLRSVLSGETFTAMIDKDIEIEDKTDAAVAYFAFIRVAIKTLTAVASKPLIYVAKNTVVSAGAALQYAGVSAKTYGAAAVEAPAEEKKKPEAAPAAA